MAKAVGIQSALSLPISASPGPAGVLTCYSRGKGAFDDHAKIIAARLAELVATLLDCSGRYHMALSKVSQLEQAVQSRDIIGQAKGILMARRFVTSDQAFQLLRSASQALNRKLRDVAEGVVLTGDLPDGLSQAIKLDSQQKSLDKSV